MFKFSAHTPFFAIVSIESAQLIFGLEWKPALPAVQTNTFSSVVPDKSKDRTKRTKYASNQQSSDDCIAVLVMDVIFSMTFWTAAVYPGSPCPTASTTTRILGNVMAANPANGIFIACLIHFCHGAIQHL
jgi:hypothetical protein